MLPRRLPTADMKFIRRTAEYSYETIQEVQVF